MNFKQWFLNEVTQDLIDKVLKDVKNKDKPFADIFGEKDRIVIPYTPDESTSLENKILAKLRNVGEIDLDKGIIKIDKRDYKLGRFILQSQQDNKTKKVVLQKPSENTKPYFADEEIKWWNTYGDPIKVLKVYDEKEKYAVIVSRNVVDVLRMSDHDNWTSCHAPTGNFFHCAIAEAKNAGGLAYVVKKEDLKNVDLNKHEIFKDKDRKIEGATPIARLRIRLFKNKEDGHDLAIPEDRVYGLKLDGLQDTIRKWAYESQEDKLSHRPRLKEYELMGGSYQDTKASELFNIFFDDDLDKGGADYGGEEQEDVADLYDREVSQILEEYNNNFKMFSVYASVEDGDGHPYVSYGGSLGITFPNVKLLKDFDGDYRNKHRDDIKDWAYHHDIYGINTYEIQLKQVENDVFFGVYIEDEDSRLDPDSFRDFCRHLSYIETRHTKEIKNSLFFLLMKLGYIAENIAFSTIQDKDHKILNNLKNFKAEKFFSRDDKFFEEFSVTTKEPISLYNIYYNAMNKTNLTDLGLQMSGYNFIHNIMDGKEAQKIFHPSLQHKLEDVIKAGMFNFIDKIISSQMLLFPPENKMDLEKLIYRFAEISFIPPQRDEYFNLGVKITFNIESHENDENTKQIIDFLATLDDNFNGLSIVIKREAHKLLDPYLKTIFKTL